MAKSIFLVSPNGNFIAFSPIKNRQYQLFKELESILACDPVSLFFLFPFD